MRKIPRDYQEAADEALWRQVHAHPDENPLVILPTGTGKSLNMAMFIWRMLHSYPHVRVLSVTHVKELVEGNHDALVELWPSAPVGLYSAGLKRRDTRAQVTFAGIGSVAKRAATFGHIDFVIVDEAHRISDSDSTLYAKFFAKLREKNPHLIVIGFTATDYRMKTGRLTEGALFDSVAFDLSDGEAFVWLLDNYYLARLVPKKPEFQLDESKIAIRMGDYDQRGASEAMHEQDLIERAVDLTIAAGVEDNRQSWLTFAQSIEDAELIADMFQYKGHDVRAVHSKRDDRDEVLAAFKAGKIRGAVNKDVLTTGFDHPGIDLISVLRLTRSPGLWVQMLGRGTRPLWVPGYDLTTLEGRRQSMLASAKQDCLVLDFCGNTARLGPINYPNVPGRRKKGSKSGDMARACPECDTYNHISVKVCECCGYEFPPPERVQDKASEAELVRDGPVIDLKQQPPPKEYGVHGVHRMICMHNQGKGGKLDTMRVDYFSGARRFSTWLGFEHPDKSFPRRKAEEWWKAHGGQGRAPTDISTVVEAAAGLTKPKFLKVWVNTKYPEIVGYDFQGTRFELPPELGGPPLADPGPDPLAEVHERAAKQAAEMKTTVDNILKERSYGDDIPF